MTKARAYWLAAAALVATLVLSDSADAQRGRDRGGMMRDRPSPQSDRAATDFPHIDKDGDGKLSLAEWRRRGNFAMLDADGDGSLSLDELRALYAGHDTRSYAWPPKGPAAAPAEIDPAAETDRVSADQLDRATLCGIGRARGKCDPDDAASLGLFETGLGPRFPENARCPGIDDYFAMDYAFKRSGEAYHGGIDMPVKWGTPIVAVAAGTVVGVFQGKDSARGIEIVLRHRPDDTGIPLWIYTQYAHLDIMPNLKVGQRVAMGEVLGPTGNSGVSGMTRRQSSTRRPAIHFATFYATDPNYAERRGIIFPADGWWMDPNALYRGAPPFDSKAIKALPESEKSVPIPVMFTDGATAPAATKLVWPYLCERR